MFIPRLHFLNNSYSWNVERTSIQINEFPVTKVFQKTLESYFKGIKIVGFICKMKIGFNGPKKKKKDVSDP